MERWWRWTHLWQSLVYHARLFQCAICAVVCGVDYHIEGLSRFTLNGHCEIPEGVPLSTSSTSTEHPGDVAPSVLDRGQHRTAVCVQRRIGARTSWRPWGNSQYLGYEEIIGALQFHCLPSAFCGTVRQHQGRAVPGQRPTRPLTFNVLFHVKGNFFFTDSCLQACWDNSSCLSCG